MAGDFGDGITDLVADHSLRLGGEGLEKFLADGGGLVLGEGEEEIEVLARLDFPGLGSDSAEDNGGKGTSLRRSRSQLSRVAKASGWWEAKTKSG